MHNLLSRQAEAVFWLARQIERANNVARVVDITSSFGRHGEDKQPWEAILALYADEDRFKESFESDRPQDVMYFYCLDPDNPNSILANINLARENARALRPLISTEMWTQLNMFHSEIMAIKRSELKDEKISAFCSKVKLACQTHAGLVAETLFREEEYFFYMLGLNLERADQTTRLVDVKYHLLLPATAAVGSQVDIAQWNTVLRSAAGFQAYRRVYHRGLTGEKVSDFLLLNRQFARSVAYTTGEAARYLRQLVENYDLQRASDVMNEADNLAAQTRDATIAEIISSGMHEWIDDVQDDIARVTNMLNTRFFTGEDLIE